MPNENEIRHLKHSYIGDEKSTNNNQNKKSLDNSIYYIEKTQTPNYEYLSVVEIKNISVRTKNVLMSNHLYTLGDIIDYVKNNNLLELKSIGKKTANEIFSLIETTPNIQTQNDQTNTESISTLFSENKYRLFAEYCKNNNINKLSDLENFDFSLLLNEPGFGLNKLRDVTKKYQELLKNSDVSNTETVVKIPSNSNTYINIDTSNKNLEISYLSYAKISPKNIAVFKNSGYLKIGDLNNISISRLIQIFGKNKALSLVDKIKLFETPIIEIAKSFFDNQYNTHNREFSIFVDRANKKTLREIAEENKITRECVRQIEAKTIKKFKPILESLVIQKMTDKCQSHITVQEIIAIFNDDINDIFSTVIIYTLQQSSLFEYLPCAYMFIIKENDAQNTKEKLRSLANELITKEGINFFEALPQIEEMLDDSGLDFISADAFLNFLIEINAYFYGDFIFLKKQSYSNLCLILIDKYFKDGIAIYSDKDINLLRNYFNAEFGNFKLPETNHAISSRLENHLTICGRGKAKLIKYINFEQSVIDDIKKYIDENPLKTLYFSEIFDKFKNILIETSDIDNYQALHGILAHLYRDEYEFSRNCITKSNSTAMSLSLPERLISYINDKGKAVSRAEISDNFNGITNIMLSMAIKSSPLLLQWDYHAFNTVKNLHITDKDISKLQEILEKILNSFKGYCSEKMIFKNTKEYLPEFLLKNHIENSINLFYTLQSIFNDQYQFSRPHICRKEIINPLTTKNVALYLLGSSQQISRSTYLKTAKDALWSEATADLIFYELGKDYTRISKDIYIRSKDFYIDAQALNNIKAYLKEHISTHGYLSMIGFDDFKEFPDIEYEWNSFLLVSVIKSYNLGVKLVSSITKDIRYNKEIVVDKNSDYYSLEDIVLDLISKNNIKQISESKMLSFLIENKLTSKTIPKELYNSKKFNYVDGYFNVC